LGPPLSKAEHLPGCWRRLCCFFLLIFPVLSAGWNHLFLHTPLCHLAPAAVHHIYMCICYFSDLLVPGTNSVQSWSLGPCGTDGWCSVIGVSAQPMTYGHFSLGLVTSRCFPQSPESAPPPTPQSTSVLSSLNVSWEDSAAAAH
jgi:hypothetical protein